MQDILSEDPTFTDNNYIILEYLLTYVSINDSRNDTYCVIDISEGVGGSSTQGSEGFAPQGCPEPLDAFFPFGLEGPFLLPAAAESVETVAFMFFDNLVSILLVFHVRV